MLTNRTQEEAAINQGAAVKQKTRFAALALLLLGGAATVFVTAAEAAPKEEGGWKKAQLTTYTSYPACCKGSEAYDPKAPKDECEDYSGCKYQGEFASIGHKSFDWVKKNNVVAFYDDDDKSGTHFNKKYGGRKIKLRKNGKEFTAIIADTCGNQDCNNCCSKNSKGGYLVDMEYWTAKRNLGGADKAEGTIEFKILD